jgi:energy-coupling factor transporter ATP-binding protein EcfA2
VLLDEPTNNMDPRHELLLTELLSTPNPGPDQLRGVLLVSHERAFLEGACTRVLEIGDMGLSSPLAPLFWPSGRPPMTWDLLADPIFRLPFLAGLLLAGVLPVLGVLLMLRDEWLAALGLAHLAAAGALLGISFGDTRPVRGGTRCLCWRDG